MRDRTALFKNTLLLYGLVISNQLLGLAAVPYLTRVLGARAYGKVGLAAAWMAYAQIAMDFGFLYSATRRAAECGRDRSALCHLFSAVTGAKAVLISAIMLIFMSIILFSPVLKADAPFYFAYLSATAAGALTPEFLYRGLANMKGVTLRAVLSRAAFTGLVFILVKTPEHVSRVPWLLLCGNLIAMIWMNRDLKKRYGVELMPVSARDILSAVKKSAFYFASRASATLYQAINIILLKSLYGQTAALGLYASADKLLGLARGLSSPVADSLYPYMIQKRDYTLVKRILFLCVPVLLLIAALVGIYAHELCALLFGEEYRAAGDLLILLIPAALAAFPSYLLSYPVMTPMGLTRCANASSVAGLCLSAALLLLFHFCGGLTPARLCMTLSATEVFVLAFRAGAVIAHRRHRRT